MNLSFFFWRGGGCGKSKIYVCISIYAHIDNKFNCILAFSLGFFFRLCWFCSDPSDE